MTHDVRTIAKLDAFHTIAYCNHDALHLNWGSLSVHIPRAHFVALGQLLTRVEIASPRQEPLSNSSGRLTQDMQGNFELRLPDLAIYLSANDMLQFVMLIEEGLCTLGADEHIDEFVYPTQPVTVSPRMWASGRYRPSLN